MTQLNQRRRGNRLENAIYDTTYTLLSQYGLDQVTFSRVATGIRPLTSSFILLFIKYKRLPLHLRPRH
ncbi:transcription regulator [Lactiplantibacillus plantarum]|nr:transcription regulator [Lactiplantibacillus plantarum]MCG0622945.1 transcription regulator [Lactiplantibacillus plantarum]MCG0732578.1 transcription regulator [Lactiplantibacillus plantarum]MCG0749932.1 transcription regulator [Lactiplantibacillus plantarum]MCG0758759.1 transcription regulator [Lactiplantibacillus plantarum]